MKAPKRLIDYCIKEKINPEALDHMLFIGWDGKPTIMWAHMQEALGKIKFPQPCNICENNRNSWLKNSRHNHLNTDIFKCI